MDRTLKRRLKGELRQAEHTAFKELFAWFLRSTTSKQEAARWARELIAEAKEKKHHEFARLETAIPQLKGHEDELQMRFTIWEVEMLPFMESVEAMGNITGDDMNIRVTAVA